jgi:hypothetical protein
MVSMAIYRSKIELRVTPTDVTKTLFGRNNAHIIATRYGRKAREVKCPINAVKVNTWIKKPSGMSTDLR